MLLVSAAPVRRVAVVMTLLASMSCGTDTPPTPEGFTAADVEGFQFAYPRSWSVVPEGEREQGSDLSVVERRNGKLLYSTVVDFAQSSTGDIGTTVDGEISFMRDQVDDLQIVSRQRIDISGASGAVVVRSEYTTTDGLNLTNLDLFTVEDGGRGALLRVTSPKASADFDLMWKVVRSAHLE